ncbi:hypothetical protein ACHAWF_004112 [Thalassiosira exigua]
MTMTPPRLLLLQLLPYVSLLDCAVAFSMASSSSSSSAPAPPLPQHAYPRPLHPGGYALPPLVEDRLPIVVASAESDNSAASSKDTALKTDILLIKPTDMESLWEWYAYTKRMSDADPSWGRVWPTALSLARWVLRSLHDDNEATGVGQTEEGGGSGAMHEGRLTLEDEQQLMTLHHARDALRTASHVVEVGCGLGVAGLTYALVISMPGQSTELRKKQSRTITFLDRDPYALHCVMSSASTNGLATGPILPSNEGDEVLKKETSGEAENGENISPCVTVRAAMDDWTLPIVNGTDDMENPGSWNNPPVQNVAYRDLHICESKSYDDEKKEKNDMVLLASDILYEPSSVESLATKLQRLLHPIHGGYAMIADPKQERTPGCRRAFIQSVEQVGGTIVMLPLSDSQDRPGGMGRHQQPGILLEEDLDIDGNLAETILLVVHFGGGVP